MVRIPLVLVVVAACGDDGGARVLPDGPTGTVTVTFQRQRKPIADHRIYFQGPDGAELASVLTDVTGKASAVVPAGSSVTAFDETSANGGQVNLYTIMGVVPGDDLTITGTAVTAEVTARFAFPASTDPSIESYFVSTSCGGDNGTSTSAEFSIDDCGPTIDTVIYARGNTNQRLDYIAKLDQPIDDLIDLRSEAWRAMPSSQAMYVNLPADEQAFRARREIMTPRGRLASCDDDGTSFGSTITLACPEIAGTTSFDRGGFAVRGYDAIRPLGPNFRDVLTSESDRILSAFQYNE